MSNNLNAERVTAGQVGKEISICDALGSLDAAITEIAAIDMSGGDTATTATILNSAATIVLSGATAAHALALVAVKRRLRFLNSGGFKITLTLGTASLVVPAGKALSVALDGTANGLTPDQSLVPAGGTAGQALLKATGDDFDTKWGDVAASGGGGGGGAATSNIAAAVDLNSSNQQLYAKNIASATTDNGGKFNITFTNPIPAHCIPQILVLPYPGDTKSVHIMIDISTSGSDSDAVASMINGISFQCGHADNGSFFGPYRVKLAMIDMSA